MAQNGITYDQLLTAGCFAGSAPSRLIEEHKTILYRDATGNVWDGTGKLPDWLQRAVNAGQTTDHFKITVDT